MSAKWGEPWDPRRPPAIDLREAIASVVVVVLVFFAIVYGLPIIAAALGLFRP